MRRTKRIRNVAFLALLVTLVWARPVSLRADSGGFYCGYGDCTLTYDNCFGDWTDYHYPDPNAGSEPGDCLIFYEVALCTEGGGGDCTCYVNLDAEGLYTWSLQGDACTVGGKEGRCFSCVQQ